MEDRVPGTGRAGYVTLTDVSTGESKLYKLERADNPSQQGTPLNKLNLLSDAAVTAIRDKFGSTPSVPSEAFIILNNGITKIAFGTTKLTPGVSTLESGTLYLCYE